MHIVATAIPDLLLLEPVVAGVGGEFAYESFNARQFEALTGLRPRFVQDNHSGSARGVLRGLHYQLRQTQGKLLRVAAGAVFDVAVDIRRSSPTFGQWVGVELSASNRRQMWIPPGFAHGFLTIGERAEVLYKTTDYYAPEFERTIAWNDPAIGIEWPLDGAPQLSGKDQAGKLLVDAEVFA
ncbi:MAG: dTDP-4-dehydrorhamnose 3,5-epimerase [Massilia sp.]